MKRTVGGAHSGIETARVESGIDQERTGGVAHVRPFFALRTTYNIPYPIPEDSISVPRDLILSLVRLVASGICVDEGWYRATYPDIDNAIRNGQFKDAQQHFVEFGYLEDRLPVPVEVDEEFYLNKYPDVRAAIHSGAVRSAQAHFLYYGYREGRLPKKNWHLL